MYHWLWDLDGNGINVYLGDYGVLSVRMEDEMNRKISWICAAVCAALLGVAYYMEWAIHIQPCPLCLVQRFVFLLLGVTFVIAGLTRANRQGLWHVYGFFIALFSSLGLITSARQVWLQHFPPDNGLSCSGNLTYMLMHFPLHQTLLTLFSSGGDCANVVMRLWGLSVPEWSLLFFIAFFITGLYFLLKRKPKNPIEYRFK